MKTLLLIVFLVFLVSLWAQEPEYQSFKMGCGQQSSILIAGDSNGKFDLEKACDAHRDLLLYHFPNPREVPNLLFHVGKLNCAKANVASRDGDKLMACSIRNPRATEIWTKTGNMGEWMLLVIDGLDYANRSYLPREMQLRMGQQVFEESVDPSLKERNHGTVDAKELRK